MNLRTYLRIKYAGTPIEVNFSRADMNQMIDDAKASNPAKAPEYDSVGRAFNSGCKQRTPKYTCDPVTGARTRLTPQQFRVMRQALRQARTVVPTNNTPVVESAPTADGTVDATGKVLRKIVI